GAAPRARAGGSSGGSGRAADPRPRAGTARNGAPPARAVARPQRPSRARPRNRAAARSRARRARRCNIAWLFSLGYAPLPGFVVGLGWAAAAGQLLALAGRRYAPYPRAAAGPPRGPIRPTSPRPAPAAPP